MYYIKSCIDYTRTKRYN